MGRKPTSSTKRSTLKQSSRIIETTSETIIRGKTTKRGKSKPKHVIMEVPGVIDPRVEDLPEKHNVVLIGNPGVGKSALLNSLLKRTEFESGLSMGGGLTQLTKAVVQHDVRYIDTPGLHDVKIMAEAAQQITKALSYPGTFTLIFVVTLCAGRMSPSELATINAVIDHLSNEDRQIEYAVVVNKATKAVLKAIKADENNAHSIEACFKKFAVKPTHIVYVPYVEALDDENNVLMDTPKEIVDLLQSLHNVKLQLKRGCLSLRVVQFAQTVKNMQQVIFNADVKAQHKHKGFLQAVEEELVTITKKRITVGARPARYRHGAGQKVHCQCCMFHERAMKAKKQIEKVTHYIKKDMCMLCYDCTC